MSIMRLESVPYGQIDSRYIDAVDVVVHNAGTEGFDVLMQMFHQGSPFHMAIHNVPPYQAVALPTVATSQGGFSLLLVTNINTYAHTVITVYAKQNGVLIAVFNQDHFIRL